LYDRRTVMDAQRNLMNYGSDVTEYLIPVLQDESGEKATERARLTALRIIASVGGPSAEDTVVKMLDDNDYKVRQAAAKALSAMAEKPSSVGPLKNLLMSDPNPNIRFNAMKALVRLAPEEETDLFIKALGDRDARIRRYAVIALGDIKSVRAIPALSQLGRDPDANVRLQLAIALAKIGNEACLPSLAELAQDQHPKVRMKAVKGVSRMEMKGAEDILVTASNGSDERLVMIAITALGDRKSDRALTVAQKHLKDERLAVRMVSIETVGKMGGEAEKPLLESLLRSESSRVRNKAEEALVSIKCNLIRSMKGVAQKNEIGALINNLGDADPRVRAAAVVALGNLKSVEAVPTLSRLADDRDLDVRLKLTQTLASTGTKDSLTTLVYLMADPDKGVRAAAVEELIRSGSNEAESILAEAAAGKDPRVAAPAMIVLGERRSAKALALAKTYLDPASGRGEKEKLVAVEVIGVMGGAKEIPLLESLEGADSSDIRRMAKKALKEVNSRT